MRARILPIVVLLTLVCGATSAAGGTIVATGVRGSHQYSVVALQAPSWDAAAADLLGLLGSNWYLATITSQPEQDFVVSMMNIDNLILGDYWLGGYQPDGELVANVNWRWITGETWSYTNWHDGEPNDWGGVIPIPGAEQHLCMWGYSMQWNDEGNVGNITGYVAETVVPEPASLFLLGTGLIGAVRAVRKRRG